MSLASKSIVVIGGGVSGLAAAAALVRKGARNVTILEASDRLGGRINSIRADRSSGGVLEMGAQWVHGKTGNVAFTIANEMGILVGKHDSDSEDSDNDSESDVGDLTEVFFTDDGQQLTQAEVQRVWQIVDRVQSMAEDKASPPTEERARLNVGQVYDNFLGKYESTAAVSRTMVRDFLHRMTRVVDGCDTWDEISFTGSFVNYEECQGNPYVAFQHDKSYSDILDYFLTDVHDCASIRLNAEVVSIDTQEDNNLKIYLNDATSMKADYVICTLPLGVLKSNAAKMFKTPLPKHKMDAIDAMGFGTVNKVFLLFDRAWWVDDAQASNDKRSASSPECDGFGFFFREEAVESSPWTRHVLVINKVEHHHSVLCAWIAGQAAIHMEKLSEDEISSDLMGLMRKFLNAPYPNIPDPIDVKISRWHSDRFFRGSYSFVSTDAEKRDFGPRTLAEPVGNVLFAGEATSSNHFSTVHGAIESGWREAERLGNMMKN